MSENTHLFCAIFTGIRMEGEELPKKSGFQGKRAKRKFVRNIKTGADQKAIFPNAGADLQQ
jgi:hypothetical protein